MLSIAEDTIITPSLSPPIQGVRLEAGSESWILEPNQEVLLGTDPRCDHILTAPGVAPRHCGLRLHGGHVDLWNCTRSHALKFAGAQVVRIRLPLDSAFEMGELVVRLRSVGHLHDDLLPSMVGKSPAMRDLAGVVRRAARLDVPVLLRGDSGSGKELTARALHEVSHRTSGPFIALNGAGLSETMAQSTLFGHVRGAFTGAHSPRQGAFRQAHGGTLFIDEVAAIPLPTQALLLRALEDKVVTPVGGDEGVIVDVRIVTATCEDLEQAVHQGRFRGDLYQRIATCVVRIPPLRQRPEDLQPLAAQALREVLPGGRLGADACRVLREYPFPGNVRELRNVVLQAAIVADSGVLTADHLIDVLRYRSGDNLLASCHGRLTDDAELLELLERCDGNMSKASRLAGLARSTLRGRIRRAQAVRDAAAQERATPRD